MLRTMVVGGSGYSGAWLVRILSQHHHVELVACTSDKWAGKNVRDRLGVRSSNSLSFEHNERALALAKDRKIQLAFLATSAEVSYALAPKLLSEGVSVIDLSGAFRLKNPELYESHYHFKHDMLRLLQDAHYGLCELNPVTDRLRADVRAKQPVLIANPGCFPTAASLALAPFLRSGLVHGKNLIVDAKSGVSGAGRKGTEEYSFCEIEDDFKAYRVLRHQHTPEIEQTLSTVSEEHVSLTFTAHLLPVRRGLLTTCYAQTKEPLTTEAANSCLLKAYQNRSFVRVVGVEDVRLSHVVGTNECVVGVAAMGTQLVAIAAIDNLIKGAAGQAVQNMNSLYDFAEDEGLRSLFRSVP